MSPQSKKMVMALPLTLTRARERVLAPFRDLVGKFGITEPQWRVLRTIGTVGALEMTQLAQITALLFPSLSRIIRDLEQRKLVTKTVHEEDLRRYVVTLSPTGQQLFDAIAPHCEAVYATIRTALGNEKLKQLHALLIELETRLDEVEFRDVEAPQPLLQEAVGQVQRRGRPKVVKA